MAAGLFALQAFAALYHDGIPIFSKRPIVMATLSPISVMISGFHGSMRTGSTRRAVTYSGGTGIGAWRVSQLAYGYRADPAASRSKA